MRDGDLETARELILDDQDGAERLFLRYLEESSAPARPKPGEIPPLDLARRLADVLFRVYELDFERGIVSYWEEASAAQKQELLPILRDHYAAYQESRRASRQMPQPFETRGRLRTRCLALADSYRKLSFGKGEIQAMMWAERLGPGNTLKTWQLAQSLGDEVGEAWGAYYFGSWAGEGQAESAAQHAVEAAERLHLPKLLQFALARLAWRALSRDDYDAHLAYLRRGLETVRKIPVRQTMVDKSGCAFYPGEAWYLKTLWRAYKLRNMPGAEAFFEQGRALSRRHGGETGELAYLMDSMQEFIRPGLFEDVCFQAESLARRLGDPGWLAAFLVAKAGGLEGTRRFAEAFSAVDEAAAIYKEMGDRYHLAECLEERATFRIQANETERAVADCTEAIKVNDELGQTEEAIWMRAKAGMALGAQPKLALRFLNDAVARAEKIDAPGITRSVYSVRAKVLVDYSPAQSLEDFKKELFYCERHRQNIGYPGEVPVAMRLVSQAMRRMGQFSEAVEMEKRRAEFCRAEGLYNAEADAYHELVNIYRFDLGEPGIAAEFAEKYRSTLIRPGRKLTVNHCDRIAGCYLAVGQPGRALEYWAKALQLARETPAGEHLERMLHINVARTSLELGDYDAAMMELEAEKALLERTFRAYQEPMSRAGRNPDSYDGTIAELSASDGQAQRKFQSYGYPIEIQKALWLNRCALTHALSGNPNKAVDESRQAIAFEFSTPPGTAQADYYDYFTPGDALAQAGELDEAVDFHKKRKDRARRIKSLPGEREALLKLGAVYAKAGKLDDARRSLQEAVRIDRRPDSPQAGHLAESLLALGSLELRAGKPVRAEDHLIEARKAANPYDLNQIWRAERALATVSAALGKYAQAEEHFELALSALEGARERLRPEEFALRFGMDRLQLYDEYAAYLAGRAIETGQVAIAEKALLAVERRRSQALWDLMALGWAGLQPDAVPAQLQRARQAEARLAAKQGILRDQFNLPPEKRNLAQISQLEAELKQVKEEHARLLTALAQGRFRFSVSSPLPSGLITDIRKRLAPASALVEYLVTDEATYAFVLSPAGHDLSRIPVSRETLRRSVRGLLNPFYGLRSGEADLSRLRFDFAAARGLYELLIAPLEPRFGKASRILVVPDDVLFYLPFELLADKTPEDGRSGQVLFAECELAGFLVRRFTMSYLTAAAQILDEPESFDEKAPASTLLAMANPAAGQESEALDHDDPVRQRLHSSGYGGAFVPLPGSRDEVARIRRFFPAGGATLLSGSRATETGYREHSRRSEIIHLATHAIAADDHPFYSTLILAPDGKKQEDGYLQAYEIVRAPLEARLVVLSACETAKGPLGRGEGLVGLVSAFLQAGARSVLATQWSIDESTAELMASFYRALTGGQDAARALRAAKLDILKTRLNFAGTEVSLAHPFFWAPFVLVGGAD